MRPVDMTDRLYTGLWGDGWPEPSMQTGAHVHPTLQLRGFLAGGTDHVLCSGVSQDLLRRWTAHAGRKTRSKVGSMGARGTTELQAVTTDRHILS